MWDYNDDGVVDKKDEDDFFWDYVMFEEDQKAWEDAKRKRNSTTEAARKRESSTEAEEEYRHYLNKYGTRPPRTIPEGKQKEKEMETETETTISPLSFISVLALIILLIILVPKIFFNG